MRLSAPDGSTAFGASAALYARRRPSYPQSVYDALEAALSGPRNHVVDLGAGSGQATMKIAKRFQRVTAVEPDARMAAEFPSLDNVDVRNAPAESVEFDAGTVDAVIAATSYHWMRQQQVAANAYRWLRPGGVFFPFRYGAFEMVGPAKSVFDKHAALWAPFKDKRLTANIEYLKPIAAIGLFKVVTVFKDEIGASLSPEEAAGLLGTTSFASAYARATYDDPEIYLETLAEEFRACSEETRLRAPLKGAIAVKGSD